MFAGSLQSDRIYEPRGKKAFGIHYISAGVGTGLIGNIRVFFDYVTPRFIARVSVSAVYVSIHIYTVLIDKARNYVTLNYIPVGIFIRYLVSKRVFISRRRIVVFV